MKKSPPSENPVSICSMLQRPNPNRSSRPSEPSLPIASTTIDTLEAFEPLTSTTSPGPTNSCTRLDIASEVANHIPLLSAGRASCRFRMSGPTQWRTSISAIAGSSAISVWNFTSRSPNSNMSPRIATRLPDLPVGSAPGDALARTTNAASIDTGLALKASSITVST